MKKHVAKEVINWTKSSNKESLRNWMLHVYASYAALKKNASEYQVWTHDFHPEQLIHPRFTRQKMRYLHYNPVVAGIIDLPEEYKYSSARNYIGRSDGVFEVEVIDFGFEEGYLPIKVLLLKHTFSAKCLYELITLPKHSFDRTAVSQE